MPDFPDHPTDEQVDNLIAQCEEFLGVEVADNGDRSEIPADWDDLWKRYSQFVSERPYLTE